MPIAYFDCFSGASGDMILGALVDAGWTGLEESLEQLHVPGWQLAVKQVVKVSIPATSVEFRLEPQDRRRGLSDMLGHISGSSLPSEVQEHASGIFQRLAEVEAGVHGCSVDEVHFHELGGLDTLLDIVGASAGFAFFKFGEVAVSPFAVGSGAVMTMHGIMPVPAPATARLLEGWRISGAHIPAELTTPTGAAILTHFASRQEMPPMRLIRGAYGAGKRDLEQPNVLRLLIGEPNDDAAAGSVVVVESTIDDMNPEIFPVAVEALLTAGALDVFLTPIQAKKGRPGTLLTFLARPGQEHQLIDVLFRETSTIGARFRTESRRTLTREVRTVETTFGPVRIKVTGQGGDRKAKPEFEDCRRLALLHGLPTRQLYESVLRQIMGS